MNTVVECPPYFSMPDVQQQADAWVEVFDTLYDIDPEFLLPDTSAADSATAWIEALHDLYMAQADDMEELEEHRAAYQLIQEHGFFEPEELLDAYTRLLEECRVVAGGAMAVVIRNEELRSTFDAWSQTLLQILDEAEAQAEHDTGRIQFLTEQNAAIKVQHKNQMDTIYSYQQKVRDIYATLDGVSC